MSHQTLKTYSDEEINILLDGDRREVDKLILHSLNSISTTLVPHIREENEVFKALGPPSEIRVRTDWIEMQIDKQKARNDMMRKVATAALVWVVPLFLAFLAFAMWDAVIEAVRAAVAKK